MTGVQVDALYDSDGWWEPGNRTFASLREVGVFRLALLRRWLPGSWAGRRVVDLGCGGGFMGVPLARDGARVVGVDVATKALGAARTRGEHRFLPVAGDLASAPLGARCADVVLLADVVEHVADVPHVVAEAARLLAPGGFLFVNTINRTLRSRLLAIALAEGLGFVPRGTHRWADFVTPEELDRAASACGLVRVQRTGETPRLFDTLRRHTVVLREAKSLAVGYAALYRNETP